MIPSKTNFPHSLACWLLLLLCLLTSASLLIGSSSLAFSEVLDSEVARDIVFNIRLPRTLASLSVGVCLSLAGLLLQTLLVNDLAEPYTLGISGGATLGVVIATALGLATDSWMQGAVALGGALVASAVVIFLARRRGLGRSRELVLLGLMISLTCGSMISLLLAWLSPTALQSVLFWMMGQFGTERDHLWPLTILVALLSWVWVYFRAQQIDQMMLGEVMAKSLSASHERFRIEVVVVATILSASAVATSGLIGFVGLIAPHVARRWGGTSRALATATMAALIGACLLLSADTLSRALAKATEHFGHAGAAIEVPAGAVVSAIGAPLLIWLLLKRRRHVHS
jgi:ABC-type Fe3+-siderophore transport system permease subunit